MIVSFLGVESFASVANSHIARFPEVEVPEPQFKQPSIYDWLVETFTAGYSQAPFMTLHDIVVPRSDENTNTGAFCANITPTTRVVTELLSQIRNSRNKFEDVVLRMIKLGINWGFIEKLPEGVAIPFIEIITRIQESPPTSWGESALDLVSRKDLKQLINGKARSQSTRWVNVGFEPI